MSKKPKLANPEGALARLKTMAETPRQTELEKFVFENFDAIAALHKQGYTVPDICAVLREEKYTASPPTLHSALNKAAIGLGKTNPFKRQLLETSDEADEITSEAVATHAPVPQKSNGLKPAY